MKLVRLAVVLLFSAIALPAAHAAEPTQQEKVQFLLKGCDFSGTDAAMFDQMSSALKSGVPPEAAERMTEIAREEFSKLYSDRETIFASAYKSVYTPEEIDRLYAFYSTPEGEKILVKNAMLTGKIQSVVMQRLGPLMERLVVRLKSDPEFQEIVRKHRKRP